MPFGIWADVNRPLVSLSTTKEKAEGGRKIERKGELTSKCRTSYKQTVT